MFTYGQLVFVAKCKMREDGTMPAVQILPCYFAGPCSNDENCVLLAFRKGAKETLHASVNDVHASAEAAANHMRRMYDTIRASIVSDIRKQEELAMNGLADLLVAIEFAIASAKAYIP